MYKIHNADSKKLWTFSVERYKFRITFLQQISVVFTCDAIRQKECCTIHALYAVFRVQFANRSLENANMH